MASKYNIYSYISYLTTIGKEVADIYRAIKKNPKYKSTTNKNIQANIDKLNAAKKAANKTVGAKPDQQIGRILNKSGQDDNGSAQVGFKFNFDFPFGSSSGKNGKQWVYITISVDSTDNIKKVRKQIMDAINEWIDKNYGARQGGGGPIRYTITDIKGN